MKIRTEADVRQLESKIRTDLGIDIAQYRNQEVIDNFIELLDFAGMAFDYFLRPFDVFHLLYRR